MTINIMNQYIELTKKQINTYLRLIFGRKFDKKYCDAFTDKYVSIRYYNFYNNDINRTVRKKIIEHLKKTEEDLKINNIQDRELIEEMRIFFYYVLYFDNVIYYKDLSQKTEQISKLRNKILNTKTENFSEELYNKMKEYIDKKEELINKFNSEEFFVKITNYPDKTNIYRVNLKYNIKFPPEYSEYAIDKAFNIGITNEDKLTIEYYLITIHILKDILKLNFKKRYILEFATTILKKPKKLKSLLNIIENAAIQDKLYLKIRYEQFIENKEKVYEMMRDGYKFAIILDNSFDMNFKNIESLKMFEFVIINKSLKHYNEIIKNKQYMNNVIEI